MSAMIPLLGDHLALPGEMGDGMVSFVRETASKLGSHPRVELQVKHEISNWAPILDFQVFLFSPFVPLPHS